MPRADRVFTKGDRFGSAFGAGGAMLRLGLDVLTQSIASRELPHNVTPIAGRNQMGPEHRLSTEPLKPTQCT